MISIQEGISWEPYFFNVANALFPTKTSTRKVQKGMLKSFVNSYEEMKRTL